MMVSRAAIVLIVYLIQGSLGYAVPQARVVRVVGGHSVDIADAPYMASVHVGNDSCGGSIIHEQFVLTAAHCINSDYPEYDQDYVRVGSQRYDTGGKKYKINKFILHENYDETEVYYEQYDVALIKLYSRLEFGTSVAPIVLSDSNLEIKPGMVASVYGWDMNTGTGIDSVELRKASVAVASLSTCMSHLKMWISDLNICASEIGGGACKYDSGGPLVAHERQIGIVSGAGNPCGFTPAVYVNVAAHTKWIHDQLINYSDFI